MRSISSDRTPSSGSVSRSFATTRSKASVVIRLRACSSDLANANLATQKSVREPPSAVAMNARWRRFSPLRSTPSKVGNEVRVAPHFLIEEIDRFRHRCSAACPPPRVSSRLITLVTCACGSALSSKRHCPVSVRGEVFVSSRRGGWFFVGQVIGRDANRSRIRASLIVLLPRWSSASPRGVRRTGRPGPAERQRHLARPLRSAASHPANIGRFRAYQSADVWRCAPRVRKPGSRAPARRSALLPAR